MTMVSNGAIGVCAGVAGALILGYCIYFDKKRRNDPNFRKMLQERRKKNGSRSAKKMPSTKNIKWPNLKDPDAVQSFFITEIQVGETLLGQGHTEAGIFHMCKAVAVCGQPQQLLQVLQQTMPPEVFNLLITTLPTVGKSIMDAVDKDDPKITEEEDLE